MKKKSRPISPQMFLRGKKKNKNKHNSYLLPASPCSVLSQQTGWVRFVPWAAAQPSYQPYKPPSSGLPPFLDSVLAWQHSRGPSKRTQALSKWSQVCLWFLRVIRAEFFQCLSYFKPFWELWSNYTCNKAGKFEQRAFCREEHDKPCQQSGAVKASMVPGCSLGAPVRRPTPQSTQHGHHRCWNIRICHFLPGFLLISREPVLPPWCPRRWLQRARGKRSARWHQLEGRRGAGPPGPPLSEAVLADGVWGR